MDSKILRKCLGQFATGVAVITARGEGMNMVGVTVSSFTSVSLDPALVLFSIGRQARSLPAMLDADGFAINVLAGDQEQLSRRFADAGGDKWENISCAIGSMRAPLLDGVLAHFECEPYAHHDGGDHVIFLVRVASYAIKDEDAPPLLFFRGKYHSLPR